MRKAEAQAEAAAGGGLHRERLLRHDRGVVDVRRDDGRAELDAVRLLAGQRDHGQHLGAEDLAEPAGVEAVVFGVDGGLHVAVDARRAAVKCGYLHQVPSQVWRISGATKGVKEEYRETLMIP